eukprot:scaffold628_cov91-Cylindrotheca_fusiformis.AAC.6
MGMVFGKTGAAEPVYESLFQRSSTIASKNPFSLDYEIRKYGARFAIETDYSRDGNTGKAFRTLAGYIGVGGSPQNDGSESISMTAPVATGQNDSSSSGGEGISMDMTAPVTTTGSRCDKGVMQFYLPAKYDTLSNIPKPLNPHVRVVEVPPECGVVSSFSGSVDEAKAEDKVEKLVQQLNDDGLSIKKEEALKAFSLWQFNPPFTIPALRRNEIWIPLTQKQVEDLLKRFQS